MHEHHRLCLSLKWAFYQKWSCLPDHTVVAVYASPNSYIVPQTSRPRGRSLEGKPGSEPPAAHHPPLLPHSYPAQAASPSRLCSAPWAHPTASCMAEFGEHCVAPPFATADREEEYWSCIWAEDCLPSHGVWGANCTEQATSIK